MGQPSPDSDFAGLRQLAAAGAGLIVVCFPNHCNEESQAWSRTRNAPRHRSAKPCSAPHEVGTFARAGR
jgi:hypothetical protein